MSNLVPVEFTFKTIHLAPFPFMPAIKWNNDKSLDKYINIDDLIITVT